MSEKPPWRKAIEDYERAIGAPLEEFIKSDEFADLAANAAKQGQTPPGTGASPTPGLGASTTQWLRSMNLPAASDIDELRAEVQALRDDVRALTEAFALEREKTESKSEPEPQPQAKPKPKPKPRAKPKAQAKPKPKPKPKPTAE